MQALTYNFDTLGNLTSRADTLQGLSETFGYDKLNRVVSINTTAKATSGATSNTINTVTYGPSGNILSRSDVGAYSYAATASGCAGLTGVRASAPGLHALSAVSGIKNAGYCYDDNGNMIAGDGRSVTWSAYDMVTAISRGSAAVGFDYGPDRQRFRRVDVDAQGKATTTLYVGGKAMEMITRPGGVVETKVYLGDFAVLSSTTGPSAPVTSARLEYLHRDHLGSVDTITDAAGAVIQRMSFDAWGKRRETGWLPIGANGIVAFDTKTTTRGFTGHEMIDSVGLVHMNGRIYDPEIGRFLSADPHVQAPDNLQSWNRYSYVINNPLSLTDPSGFFFSGLFRAIGNFLSSAFRAIGNVVKVVLSNPIIRSIVQIVGCAAATVVLGPGAPAGCAAVSALVTLGAGGSLRDALKAAAITFATIGIFSAVGPTLNAIASTGVGGVLIKAGAHGVIGGALSVAQGGSFLQGFAGSAIGALGGAVAGGEGGSGISGQYGDQIPVNQLARALISGAAGCAGAIVTGGKCAQAAVTAAFASLYNGDGLRFAASAAGGAGGAYLGAAGGGGLAALCAGLTGGACAVFAPYIVAGGTLLGRWAGAGLGGELVNWLEASADRPGSRGGEAHQGKIEERIRQLESDGYTDIAGGSKGPEERIPTPDGSKEHRRPDISAKDAAGDRYYEQVGRQTRGGIPVSRERGAIRDIEGATGIRPRFTPYN